MSDISLVITENDVLNHLGIDYADDMVNRKIAQAISYADGELRESIDDNYPVDHPLTKELALIFASVSYENRDLSGNEEKHAYNISFKIRQYMRRSSDE